MPRIQEGHRAPPESASACGGPLGVATHEQGHRRRPDRGDHPPRAGPEDAWRSSRNQRMLQTLRRTPTRTRSRRRSGVCRRRLLRATRHRSSRRPRNAGRRLSECRGHRVADRRIQQTGTPRVPPLRRRPRTAPTVQKNSTRSKRPSAAYRSKRPPVTTSPNRRPEANSQGGRG